MATFESIANSISDLVGPPLDQLALDPPTAALLRESSELLKASVSYLDYLPRGPVTKPIYAGLTDSSVINAHAVSLEEGDCVVIRSGIVLFLRLATNTLLCHRDVVSHIGDVSTCVDDVGTCLAKGLKDPEWLRRNWMLNRPQDAERARYADLLLSEALRFICFHEIGHVFHGHVDLANVESRIKMLNEIRPENLSESANLESQTLEMDADSYAATFTVTSTLDSGWARGIYALTNRPKDGTDSSFFWFQDATYLWSFASQLFFALLNHNDNLTKPLASSHPPFQFRQAYLTPAALEFFSKKLPHMTEAFSHSCVWGGIEAIKVACIAAGRKFGVEFEYDGETRYVKGFAAGLQHLEMLLDSWKQIRSRLIPLVRRGTLPE